MPSLWKSITESSFPEENDREGLVAARVQLIGKLFDCFPSGEVAVWLAIDKREGGSSFYLSRFMNQNGKIEHIPLKLDFGFHDSSEISGKIIESTPFSASFSNSEVYCSAIANVRRRGDSRELGYIAFKAERSPAYSAKICREAISQFASAYAHMLLDSRHMRMLSAHSKLEEILSNPIRIEEKIDRLKELLCKTSGSTSATFISFLGGSSGLDFASNPSLKDLGLDLDYVALSNGTLRQNFSFEGIGDSARIDSQSRSGVLVLPIFDNSRELTKESLRPISFDDNDRNRSKIVSHALVLLKHPAEETSEAIFTDTDTELVQRLVGIFQNSLGSYVYERKVSRLSKYFEMDVDDGDISATDLHEVLRNGLFKCSGITIYEYKLGKEVKKYFSGEISITSEDYDTRMEKYVLVNSGAPKNSGKILSGVDTSVDDNTTRIEFFFANEFGIVRLIVVHLDTKRVSDLDYRLLVYMMSEMRVHFKSVDSLQARTSELAQIRHAIISPVAACSDLIEGFQKLAGSHRNRTDNLWKIFGKEDEEWRTLRDAVSFAEAAKLLADSGKYLFLEPDDQSINKKPVVLNDVFSLVIKNAHLMNENGIVILQTRSGKDTDAAGRRLVPYADKSLLFLAFLNLVDNGLKYTLLRQSHDYYRPSHKELGDTQRGMIKVNLDFSPEMYSFSVENVGRFIPEVEQEKIFIPFGRGRQFMDLNPVTGTGIGLPASLKIIQGHSKRGRVEVNSVPLSQNSNIAVNTFSCKLPYQAEKERNEH